MGNHSSSCFLLQSTCKAKLIDCKGNLRHVKLPIKAAEIMLEEPGHVISPVDELLKTHRISAMTADQELSAGKVYLFVPVSRVNGKVKRQDIDMIEAACRKKKSLKKSKKNGAKVLPAVTMNDEVKVEKEVDQVTVLGGNDTGFSGYRFGKHRQWSPVLEAISEVY